MSTMPKAATTRVFQNGNSQALRIPQSLRTDKQEFFIRKIGDVFIAYPADDPWAPTRQAIGSFPDDFMADRNQPSWDDVTTKLPTVSEASHHISSNHHSRTWQ